MFVVSKRNIILPGPNGEKFHMHRDYMGPVPSWAEKSAYLKALEADGKVIISATGKDIDAAEKGKRGKNPPKAKQKSLPEEPSGEENPESSGEKNQEEY